MGAGVIKVKYYEYPKRVKENRYYSYVIVFPSVRASFKTRS